MTILLVSWKENGQLGEDGKKIAKKGRRSLSKVLFYAIKSLNVNWKYGVRIPHVGKFIWLFFPWAALARQAWEAMEVQRSHRLSLK